MTACLSKICGCMCHLNEKLCISPMQVVCGASGLLPSSWLAVMDGACPFKENLLVVPLKTPSCVCNPWKVPSICVVKTQWIKVVACGDSPWSVDVFFIIFKGRIVHPLLLMHELCNVFEVFSLESDVVSLKSMYYVGCLLIPHHFSQGCSFFFLSLSLCLKS